MTTEPPNRTARCRFLLLIVIAALAAIILHRNAPKDPFTEGMLLAARGGQDDEAARLLARALDTPAHTADAHAALAEIHERRPERLTLAVWHAEQALKHLPRDDSRRSRFEHMRRNLRNSLIRLWQSEEPDRDEPLRAKIILLEDYARNQNRWLNELRDENRRLRIRLGESEDP